MLEGEPRREYCVGREEHESLLSAVVGKVRGLSSTPQARRNKRSLQVVLTMPQRCPVQRLHPHLPPACRIIFSLDTPNWRLHIPRFSEVPRRKWASCTRASDWPDHAMECAFFQLPAPIGNQHYPSPSKPNTPRVTTHVK